MKKQRKPAPTTKKVLNPFEVHINKQKMTVLGQKTKNDRGLPGVSRGKALNKRKQTLLKEYKLQHKNNRFVDKRIGEKSTTMTSEDKVMARYTAVRKKAHKKSIYNLADDEVLTHRGQTLAEIEKFEDPRSDDDEEEDRAGNLGSKFVEKVHFGGGMLTQTGKEGARTHRDLIDELIAESKKRRAEKQKTKENTMELTNELDTEWKDMIPLLNKKQKSDDIIKAPKDAYDKFHGEVRFGARGTVSDRLKTEEEIAQEEKEKLEKLEKERQERMRGFEDNKRKHRSADDLDDDFVYESDPEPDPKSDPKSDAKSDPELMLSYNQKGEPNVKVVAQINGKNVGEKSDNENDEEEKDCEGEEEAEEEEDNGSEEAENDDDLSDLKNDTSESEEDEEDDEKGEEEATEKSSELVEQESEVEENATKNEEVAQMEEVMKKAEEELPHTFSIPASYESLQELFENQSIANQSVIIERMIKFNHPSLGQKNKESLRLLFAYLLQYLNDSATDTSIGDSFKVFTALAPHLFDLTQLDKLNAYTSIKEVLKEKREEFKEHKKTFPGLEVLIFFKLISLLFPTSDFRHGVVTPSLVFMDDMLNSCRVKSRKDVAYGLFVVTLVLEYTTLSKRYLPAAINYLGGLLHMAIPKVGVKLIKVNRPFQPTTNSLVLVNDCNEDDFEFKLQASDLATEQFDDSFRVTAIYVTLKLIEEFDDNLACLSSNVEIFENIVAYLELLPTKNYPQKVCNLFEKVSQQLKSRKSDRKLEYVVMESKIKALRLYEPKIEEVSEGKKWKVQSKEKAERDKLVHKFKKEKKGALREIRRDNAFLGRVKIQERIKSDQERRDKVKRIYAEASMQQSELNEMDRKKKRK